MKKMAIFLFIMMVASLYFPQKIVGLKVNGNDQTRAFVIENLVGYRYAMPVNIDELEKGQQKLLNSGLFSSVYMNLEASGDNYVLIVDVREKPHLLPYFDVEKGLGLKNEDLFGLNLTGRASLRFFNLSPFKFFWGGYSLELSSLRALGTPFSVDVEYSDLKNLYWQDEHEKFDYSLSSLAVGAGYTWPSNNIILSYMFRKVPNKFSSSSVFLKFTHTECGDSRELWNWDFDLEHALNSSYTTARLNVKRYYRIIAQIYSLTRFCAVYNGGKIPFLAAYHFGGVQNLKGYDLREFYKPIMALAEERIGVPLTMGLKISKSPNLTFVAPEAIGQIAFIEDEGFKLSVGLGIKFTTAFGNFEPEFFYGKKFAFYFEVSY